MITKDKRLVVDIPPTLHRKFKKFCKENGLKQNHTITNMMSKFLIEAEGHPNYFRKLSEQRK